MMVFDLDVLYYSERAYGFYVRELDSTFFRDLLVYEDEPGLQSGDAA
jgi:hypothetical protein